MRPGKTGFSFSRQDVGFFLLYEEMRVGSPRGAIGVYFWKRVRTSAVCLRRFADKEATQCGFYSKEEGVGIYFLRISGGNLRGPKTKRRVVISGEHTSRRNLYSAGCPRICKQIRSSVYFFRVALKPRGESSCLLAR